MTPFPFSLNQAPDSYFFQSIEAPRHVNRKRMEDEANCRMESVSPRCGLTAADLAIHETFSNGDAQILQVVPVLAARIRSLLCEHNF